MLYIIHIYKYRYIYNIYISNIYRYIDISISVNDPKHTIIKSCRSKISETQK